MATSTRKDKKVVRRERFPEGTKQVWKASKAYSWGLGWRLVNKQDVLKEGADVSLRLDVKNLSEHTPLVGEEWEVSIRGWRHTEGDVDKQEKPVIYIEGFLEQKVVHTKKTAEQQKKEMTKKPVTPAVVAKKRGMDVSTDVLPFRDPANPDRVLYMNVTLVDGKVTSKRLQRTGTLDGYLTAGANNLRELIEGVLTNPYKGIKKTKGVIEKYSQVPLEEIITPPPFLTA